MSISKSAVGIVAKTSAPLAREITEQLISWLEFRSIPYFIDSQIAREIKLEKIRPEFVLERSELPKLANPIVVLGGDGTLISASRHPSETPCTIIGVNLGTLGFLTEISIDELFSSLESVLNRTAIVDTRSLLKASVIRGGAELASYHAINDIVVTKEALARIFAIDVNLNGSSAAVIRGDGVIIATPGGSTAYSLAAGGSIVHPSVDALLITPICPHSLTTRPLVIPGNFQIRLNILLDGTEEIDQVYLTIDGQEGMKLQVNDQICVTTSNYRVNFARSPSKTYFEILGTKLKWANR